MSIFTYPTRNYGGALPSINWSHPITRGLTGAFLPGYRYNIADGRFFTNQYATAPTLGSRSRGRAIIAGAYQTPEPANSSSVHAKFDRNVLTALVVTVQDTAQNAGHSFFRGNGSSTPGWLVGLWGGSANGPYVTMGSWTANIDLGANYTRVPHVIVLAADGTTATCYADGVSVASSSYTAPTYQYSSARSVFFGAVNGINGATQERPSLGLFWNRPLTPNEIKLVSENPEIVFLPIARLSFVPSGATPTTINAGKGNAAAAGSLASVIRATTINAAKGAAAAAGPASSVVQAFNVNANVGNSSALGRPASVANEYRVSAVVGLASANGSSSAIVLATQINAYVGASSALGLPASISASTAIDAAIGNASATGSRADVSQATQINCAVGLATALGIHSQIIAGYVINAGVGSASSSGGLASITSGSDDLYPLAGLAESYPITGAEIYPLAGLI